MKKPLKTYLPILVFALLACMSSCSEEADCSMATRATVQCNLFHHDRRTGIVEDYALETLTVTADKTDSVIVNNQTEVHDLILPLRYTADSTKLIFRYSKELPDLVDTVVIYHTNTPYFLSMDCGYQMKQSIERIRYTRRVLDSIYISNPEANIYAKENLKLFY